MGLKVHFEKRFEDIKHKPFDSFENCKYVNIKNTDVIPILESDDLIRKECAIRSFDSFSYLTCYLSDFFIIRLHLQLGVGNSLRLQIPIRYSFQIEKTDSFRLMNSSYEIYIISY